MYRRSLPQRLRLEGGRCGACGVTQFPPRAACPRCRGPLEPVRLSGRGQVVAATFITPAGAPPEFAGQARQTGGYWVAIVALAEGPCITAQLTQAAAPGAPVMAVVRRLYEEDGVVRYGFKFAPQGVGDP
jgi:uncharacterized OB-fold protein